MNSGHHTTPPDPPQNAANRCQAWWGKRRWYFLWLGWRHWTFNVHSSRDCHRLSFQIGPFGFRWCW